MRLRFPAVLAVAVSALVAPAAAAAEPQAGVCPDPGTALGVSRVIEIDPASGPLFGSISKRVREPSFLAPMEVVLTFDDGPIPKTTTPILETLDRFCTKATFFPVGEMAAAYPAQMKEVLRRGHTVGAHTYTHPSNLPRLKGDRATLEIERGFAAVSLATGAPIAPFFRFPGLNDSDKLLTYLDTRDVATLSVDIISNDSFIGNPKRLADRVLGLIDKRKGGILLFHDIKTTTAKALPSILEGLKSRGYSVVHLVAKVPMVPQTDFDETIKARMAKAVVKPQVGEPPAPIAVQTADGEVPPSSSLASPVRDRTPPPPKEATTLEKAGPGGASRETANASSSGHKSGRQAGRRKVGG